MNQKLFASRLLIGIVLFFNVQCAVAFLGWPEAYAPGFEMSGPVGEGMVRGMGILFLMWNVPYASALTDPVRRRVSLVEAIIMQAVGFAGELLLLLTFEPGHAGSYAVLRGSLARFIAFDGAGLVLLLLAWMLTARMGREKTSSALAPAPSQRS